MTNDTAPALRRRLAEQLADEDSLHDPELRRAVETVPRETFLGRAGPLTGTPTSSSTLPGLIARGKRALIIGAGTGLSTAYVSEVLGEDNTTAIETDPAAAERARKALAEAGYAPTLITADGLLGYADKSPYDIVLAFCSMRHIPYGLLRQVKEGGTIVVTLAALCSMRCSCGAASWCTNWACWRNRSNWASFTACRAVSLLTGLPDDTPRQWMSWVRADR